MSTFFRGITETIPSLFRGIFSERNSVPNPRWDQSARRTYPAKVGTKTGHRVRRCEYFTGTEPPSCQFASKLSSTYSVFLKAFFIFPKNVEKNFYLLFGLLNNAITIQFVRVRKN
jgi:hypothetical protein